MISFKSLRQNQQSHRILYLSSRNTDRCVRSWRVWCTGVNGSGGVACCPNLGTETPSVNTLQTSFFFFFLDSHLFSSHLSLHTADVLIRESWALQDVQQQPWPTPTVVIINTFSRLSQMPPAGQNCPWLRITALGECTSTVTGSMLLIEPITPFPGGSEVKVSACSAEDLGFDPWVGKIPWRRKWQLTPVFLPGEPHGRRSLVGSQRVRHD